MKNGWIYVLINPTMPGLAKVGKTSRDPNIRVAELSGATGVASPFILTYQQPVDDCDFAESWVHRELERKGFRHANNREFFNGPLHEIVAIVCASAAVAMEQSKADSPDSRQAPPAPTKLANELVEMALDAMLGTDHVFENPKKAQQLFEQAATLNHIVGCRNAGMGYQIGIHVKLDNERALDYYDKAVRAGGWEVAACMADLFLQAGKLSAAKKHWNEFFENACAEFDGVPVEVAEAKNHMAYPKRLSSRVHIICDAAAKYCLYVANGRIEECVPNSILLKLKPYVEIAITRKIKFFSDSPNAHMFVESAREWRDALNYLELASG